MPDARRLAWPAVVAAALALLTTSALAASPAVDQAKAALREKPPNYEVALPLLADAAKRNDPAALFLLGVLTERGLGTPKDFDRAVVLCEVFDVVEIRIGNEVAGKYGNRERDVHDALFALGRGDDHFFEGLRTDHAGGADGSRDRERQ